MASASHCRRRTCTGVILRENMTPEREAAFEAALGEAMEAGADVLRNGGEAIDAVQAAVDAAFLVDVLKAANVAVIHNDTEYGVGLGKEISAEL